MEFIDDGEPSQQIQTLEMGSNDNAMGACESSQPVEDMQAWSLTDLLAPDDASALEVKVCFRQEDASRCYVSDSGGCRLYFGQNIPDISQLLQKEYLDGIMKMFRYERHHYFGPESWQQIQVKLFRCCFK